MIKYLLLLLTVIWAVSAQANMNFAKDFSLKKIPVDLLSDQLTTDLFSKKSWPEKVTLDETEYTIEYSIKEDLKNFIKKELKRYGSDFASVVVINNNNGEILSALDYTRETKSFGKNLTFSATSPAASIFKVVTAAELLENANLEKENEFTYNGKATTLYKYQLKDKKNRWTRKTTFKKAFARSNNVVFGKAAIAHSDFNSLTQMAHKFGFDQDLMQLVDAGNSKLFTKNSEYGLAELASGFNKGTMISPVHGAVIASIIANDGILKKPSIVSKVSDDEKELLIWEPKDVEKRIISKDSASAMRDLMELTVKKGTARSAFRRHRKRVLNELVVGGKTGTITGGLPYGKRDWFVSYAIPKNKLHKGISVCVMIVNVKKWYIKSPALAKNIIEYYYSRVQKIGKL